MLAFNICFSVTAELPDLARRSPPEILPLSFLNKSLPDSLIEASITFQYPHTQYLAVYSVAVKGYPDPVHF